MECNILNKNKDDDDDQYRSNESLEKVKKQNLVRHGVMAKEIQREPQSVASSDFFSFSEECCGDEEYAVLDE